jgi:hypothetical protein
LPTTGEAGMKYLFGTPVAVMAAGCLQAQEATYIPGSILTVGAPFTLATDGFNLGGREFRWGDTPQKRELLERSSPSP